MSEWLPQQANLEWLKKLSKERLRELRVQHPETTLNQVQLAVAREYGFASWRKLKAHVEATQIRLQAQRAAWAEQLANPEVIFPDDPGFARFFSAIDARDVSGISKLLKSRSTEIARMLVVLRVKPDLYCAAGMGSMKYVRECFDDSGRLIPDAARCGSNYLADDGIHFPRPTESPVNWISDALYIASRNAHAEVVDFLLTKQPDLSFKGYLGGSPFHWAYYGGSRAVIDLLKEAGADPHSRDNDLHCTPRAFGICAAARWGLPLMVRQRLAEDPSLANLMDGRTSPLHEAARGPNHRNLETVQLLLDAGADPSVVDGESRKPLDIARELGHTGVVSLLEPLS